VDGVPHVHPSFSGDLYKEQRSSDEAEVDRQPLLQMQRI
jgi:hypothetical protein